MSTFENQDINNTTLVASLRSRLGKTLPGKPVRLAYLYGSTSEGRQTSLSDIDIGLILDPESAKQMSGYQRLILESDIGLALERYCKLENTDIRVVNDAPIMLQGQMVQRGLILYARDDDIRVDYEVYTLMKYLDFLPIAESFQREYFQRRKRELQVLHERKNIND